MREIAEYRELIRTTVKRKENFFGQVIRREMLQILAITKKLRGEQGEETERGGERERDEEKGGERGREIMWHKQNECNKQT